MGLGSLGVLVVDSILGDEISWRFSVTDERFSRREIADTRDSGTSHGKAFRCILALFRDSETKIQHAAKPQDQGKPTRRKPLWQAIVG
jgi:hypothetical protein